MIQRIAWFVLLTLIRWISIYPVDSVIHAFDQLGPGQHADIVVTY